MGAYIRIRGVEIHLSRSIYRFYDQPSNSIEAIRKHRIILSPSLKYAFILKVPWHVHVTVSIHAQLLSKHRFICIKNIDCFSIKGVI